MTAAVPTVRPAAVPAASRGVDTPTGRAARIFSGALFTAAGLLVTAVVLGVAVAGAMLGRGVVLLDAGDVAFVRTVSPMAALLTLLGIAHLVAATGLALGSRTLAAFGIGIGAIDVVAGILTLIAVALTPAPAINGAAIGVLAILVGTVLAVAARAAEWGVAPLEA